MKKRVIVAVLMASMLVGCKTASKEEAAIEPEEVTVEESTEEVDEAEEREDEGVETEESWREAYYDYLTTNEDVAPDETGNHGLQVTMIYLDDDDVPELFIDTGMEAGGEIIATYYDGEVVSYNFPRLGSQYIERSGLVYTNTGHMDYYPLTITKLEDGEFREIGVGLAYLSEADREHLIADENYPYILTYEWEDELVSEEQFNANVAEIYDMEQSVYPEEYVPYDEFVKELRIEELEEANY